MIRFLLFLLFITNLAYSIEKPKEELVLAGLSNSLGKNIDLSLEFTNSQGQAVKLKDFFKEGRPVIIIPGYFTCPRLCGLVFDGVADLIDKLNLEIYKDYQVLAVSFDENDTPKSSKIKEKNFLGKIKTKEINSKGVKFLTAEREVSASLMQILGFKYLREGKDFAHSAAIYVLTAEGKISQYFTGVTFSTFDLKLSLVEASRGKVGNLLDQAMLFCFRFDPLKGRYTWLVYAILKIFGVLTILLLGGLLLKLSFANRKQ